MKRTGLFSSHGSENAKVERLVRGRHNYLTNFNIVVMSPSDGKRAASCCIAPVNVMMKSKHSLAS